MIWLKIKRLDKSLPMPKYETEGAAGIDLRTAEDFDIYPGERILVETGIAVEIHEDYVGVIKSRSGIASKQGVDVQAGVIDSDYTGHVKVLLHNTSDIKHSFAKGNKIAQMMIVQCPQCIIQEVEELNSTQRGAGGFGSTGI